MWVGRISARTRHLMNTHVMCWVVFYVCVPISLVCCHKDLFLPLSSFQYLDRLFTVSPDYKSVV